jgi:hypothetical protein
MPRLLSKSLADPGRNPQGGLAFFRACPGLMSAAERNSRPTPLGESVDTTQPAFATGADRATNASYTIAPARLQFCWRIQTNSQGL